MTDGLDLTSSRFTTTTSTQQTTRETTRRKSSFGNTLSAQRRNYPTRFCLSIELGKDATSVETDDEMNVILILINENDHASIRMHGIVM
jgi:hypothetical protein